MALGHFLGVLSGLWALFLFTAWQGSASFMSLAALRRARSLSLKHLLLLRHAGGIATCIDVAAAATGGGSTTSWLPVAGPSPGSQLWRHESPLLRHLSSSAAVRQGGAAAAAATTAGSGGAAAMPPYEQLKAQAAAAAARSGGGGSDPKPLLELLPGQQSQFDRLLFNFQVSGTVKDQALALYVNSKVGGGSCRCRTGAWQVPGSRLPGSRFPSSRLDWDRKQDLVNVQQAKTFICRQLRECAAVERKQCQVGCSGQRAGTLGAAAGAVTGKREHVSYSAQGAPS